MISLTLWYSVDQDGDHVANTAADLDSALDTVAAIGTPTWAPVAEITRTDGWEDGGLLYAGFHGEVGVLRFTARGDKKASYSCDSTNPDDTSTLYMFQENDMEFPANAEIHVADVRRAVHEFAATAGKRPSCVQWQHWQAPDTPGTDIPDNRTL